MTKYQKMFYDIKNEKDYKIIGEDIDYKIILDHENREIILQWRESDSRADWTHNFMFIPWLLKLDENYVITTHGYACAYKSTNSQPLNELIEVTEKYPGYKVIIRGWSFGSAMTKISARHYYIRTGKKLYGQYTYGDVKCWFNPFLCFRKYAEERFEFVTSNDIVTWQVPFFFRTAKAKVGEKFSFKKIFHPEIYHTSYETYNYAKYE